MPFVLKADGNAILAECPQLLIQLIVDFLGPLPRQKGADLGTSREKLAAVPPLRIFGVGHGNSLRVTAIPRILGSLHLGQGGLERKGGPDWMAHENSLSPGDRARSHRRHCQEERPGLVTWHD